MDYLACEGALSGAGHSRLRRIDLIDQRIHTLARSAVGAARVTLSAVAFLEFFLAAARAWVVAANILQGVAHWLLGRVAAVWTMDVCVLVVVVVIMVVVAVRAMNVGFLVHRGRSRIKSAGIIAQFLRSVIFSRRAVILVGSGGRERDPDAEVKKPPCGTET